MPVLLFLIDDLQGIQLRAKLSDALLSLLDLLGQRLHNSSLRKSSGFRLTSGSNRLAGSPLTNQLGLHVQENALLRGVRWPIQVIVFQKLQPKRTRGSNGARRIQVDHLFE